MRLTLLVVIALAIGASVGFVVANHLQETASEITSNPSAHAAAHSSINPPSYALPNTAVHLLRSDRLGRTYPIWVDMPAAYNENEKKYPVVFVTDANYSFPLVRSIRNLLGQRGRNIEDFILVGLAPAEGDTSAVSRCRDYTPTDPLRNLQRNGDSYNAKLRYGEAAAYRDHLEAEVFPLIEKHYRADMSRKVFAGHSFGGLFGAYVLMTKPELFQRYILSSPSLWFDGKNILERENADGATNRDLNAHVWVYAGSYETIQTGERYFKSNDIVKGMQVFERLLKSPRFPSFRIESEVIQDEDHLTVYPSAISRGLLKALPGFGPYTSG